MARSLALARNTAKWDGGYVGVENCFDSGLLRGVGLETVRKKAGGVWNRGLFVSAIRAAIFPFLGGKYPRDATAIAKIAECRTLLRKTLIAPFVFCASSSPIHGAP